MNELVKSGKHHDLYLCDTPLSDDFKTHSRVFQVRHKQYGTCPAEGVNFAQAVHTLGYLDTLEDQLEGGNFEEALAEVFGNLTDDDEVH